MLQNCSPPVSKNMGMAETSLLSEPVSILGMGYGLTMLCCATLICYLPIHLLLTQIVLTPWSMNSSVSTSKRTIHIHLPIAVVMFVGRHGYMGERTLIGSDGCKNFVIQPLRLKITKLHNKMISHTKGTQ